MTEDSPFALFMDKADEALSKAYGFQWRVANIMDTILKAHGFVNIGCKKFKAPLGRWPKVSPEWPRFAYLLHGPCFGKLIHQRRIRNYVSLVDT
jgi:hypothetical protein